MRTTMSPEEKLTALRAAEGLAGRSDAELEAMAGAADELTVAPGAVLAQENRPSAGTFVVLDGEARLERNGMVATAGPGALIGDPTDPPSTATALTLMHLLQLGS
jgi:quercetin dioxygenase-like cupin family protein